MSDTKDLLQLKIDTARNNLPKETLEAVDAVDWRTAILGLREKKGYSFEQLGNLEIETELVLSGLLDPQDYPNELEKRMGISKAQVNELVNEMNTSVFEKIREELIKNSERQKIFQKKNKENTLLEDQRLPVNQPFTKIEKHEEGILGRAGIKLIDSGTVNTDMSKKVIEDRKDLLKEVENPELISKKNVDQVHSIVAQKLSAPYNSEVKTTEHSLDNLKTKLDPKVAANIRGIPQASTPSSYPHKADPYRLSPDE